MVKIKYKIVKINFYENFVKETNSDTVILLLRTKMLFIKKFFKNIALSFPNIWGDKGGTPQPWKTEGTYPLKN